MCASQMRLVDKIRQRLVQEQVKLTDRLAQIIGFTKSTDTESIIDKERIPDKAREWLLNQKETLIESFPRENTAKLRATNDMANIDQYAVLVMFKQLLRAQNSRLVSRKIYNWSTSLKKQQYTLEYRILTCQNIGRKRVSRYVDGNDTKKFKPTLNRVEETTTPPVDEKPADNTDTTPDDEENKTSNTDTTPPVGENPTDTTPVGENKSANTETPTETVENKPTPTDTTPVDEENKSDNTDTTPPVDETPAETVKESKDDSVTPTETVEKTITTPNTQMPNIDVSPKTSDTEVNNTNIAPNTPPPSPISP